MLECRSCHWWTKCHTFYIKQLKMWWWSWVLQEKINADIIFLSDLPCFTCNAAVQELCEVGFIIWTETPQTSVCNAVSGPKRAGPFYHSFAPDPGGWCCSSLAHLCSEPLSLSPSPNTEKYSICSMYVELYSSICTCKCVQRIFRLGKLILF